MLGYYLIAANCNVNKRSESKKRDVAILEVLKMRMERLLVVKE